jgi:predicted O-methyltransferase YrrM
MADVEAWVWQSALLDQHALLPPAPAGPARVGPARVGTVSHPPARARVIEGHSGWYLDTIVALAALARRKEVRTVCEVGFNLGHSALAALEAASPRAHVVSFDIGLHTYTAGAARWVMLRHRGRLSVQLGHSAWTVPTFARLHRHLAARAGEGNEAGGARGGLRPAPETVAAAEPSTRGGAAGSGVPGDPLRIAGVAAGRAYRDDGPKCDLIFVDGDHSAEGAYTDLSLLREIARRGWNRVVIDNAESESVQRAWRQVEAEGKVRRRAWGDDLDAERGEVRPRILALGEYVWPK